MTVNYDILWSASFMNNLFYYVLKTTKTKKVTGTFLSDRTPLENFRKEERSIRPTRWASRVVERKPDKVTKLHRKIV